MRALPKEWLDARWIRGDGTTLIQWADESKRIYVSEAPFKPYFFIREKDLSKVGDLILGVGASVERGDYLTIYNEPAVKVECDYPDEASNSVRVLRDKIQRKGVEAWEADIPFIRRVMIDMGIVQAEIKKRAYVDIECEALKGFPDPNQASHRIIAISVVGSDGKEEFISEEDEVAMLKSYIEALKPYGVVTGWNWRKFDGLYLENRIKRLKLDFGWLPIQDIDIMMNYLKLNTWGFIGKGYRLENVAKVHLGIDHDSAKTKVAMEELWESFKGDKKKLREYNLTDARIVRELDKMLALIDPYLQLSYMFPIFLRDTPFMNLVWDSILLHEVQKDPVRIVFPCRKEQEAELIGGYTLESKPGVHRLVFSLDFKALYPSIMMTMGLSPETVFLFQSNGGGNFLDSEGRPIPDTYRKYQEFIRANQGRFRHCYTDALERFLKLRDEAKAEMKKYKEGTPEFMNWNLRQAAFKLLNLSSYGVAGYYKTRFFNPNFFNAVTGMGQHILKWVIEHLEAMGYTCLYGDTDSVFVKAQSNNPLEVPEEVTALASMINSALKDYLVSVFGVDPTRCLIKMEPKNCYEWILFTGAKKKYRGDVFWVEGEWRRAVDLMGFEAKRGETFPLMAKAQMEIMNYLGTEKDPDKIIGGIRAYLLNLFTEMIEGKHDKELTIEMTLRKEKLEDYEHEDPHTRAARQLMEKGILRPGDKVKWVVVSTDNGRREVAIDPRNPDQIPKIHYSGYLYYFNRILNMVERLLGVPVMKINKKAGDIDVYKSLDEFL